MGTVRWWFRRCIDVYRLSCSAYRYCYHRKVLLLNTYCSCPNSDIIWRDKYRNSSPCTDSYSIEKRLGNFHAQHSNSSPRQSYQMGPLRWETKQTALHPQPATRVDQSKPQYIHTYTYAYSDTPNVTCRKPPRKAQGCFELCVNANRVNSQPPHGSNTLRLPIPGGRETETRREASCLGNPPQGLISKIRLSFFLEQAGTSNAPHWLISNGLRYPLWTRWLGNDRTGVEGSGKSTCTCIGRTGGIGLVGGLGLSSQRGLLDDARRFGKWGSL
jgi:hypothetical protein